MLNRKKTGFIIPLAWPETYCKQAGAWYDGIMNKLGFAKDHYYKVGHAALVLVDASNGQCHYFDFGRYHAPFGHGRVRNAETDHDLRLPIKAQVIDNQLINLNDILNFLDNNEACHGTGKIEASYCEIDFENAMQKALLLQQQSPIIYGPFVWSGTNCSRFVRTVALAGKPSFLNWLRLFFPLTLSPTPFWNVKAVVLPSKKINYSEDVNYGTIRTIKNYPC